MNQAFEIPYFYRNRLNREALKLISGQHLYVTGTAGYPISSWFEEQLGIKEKKDIEEGCNVVNFSLAIAHAMGCNPIILVGLDLAYTQGKSYAPGIHNHPLHNRKEYFGTKSVNEDPIVKPDIFGQPTFTLWKWIAESTWFSQFAQLQSDRVFINATEGGIGFTGIPNMALSEVAEQLLLKEYDFEGLIHSQIAKASHPISRKAVVEQLQTLLKSLERSEKLCETIQKECEERRKKTEESNPLSEEGLKALRQLEQEIAFTHILNEFSTHFLDIQRIDYDALKSDFHPNENEIQKARLNELRYLFLKETAKVNRKILEKALKEASDEELRQLMRSETATEPLAPLKQELPTPDPSAIRVQQHHPNGQLAVEQFFVEAKLHGPSTFYSEQGTLLSRRFFVHGLPEGESSYFSLHGKLEAIQRFQNGLPHGTQETFYPDGKRKSVLPYQAGKLHGEVELYYPSGHLKRQLPFVEGKRHGVERIWNESGLLVIEATFNQDLPTGVARQWYDNGNMALEVTYEENPHNFLIREWDEAGFPCVTERRITGDYFDQVARQTDKLTKTLIEVFNQVKSLSPLVDAALHKPTTPLPNQDAIKKELENLKRISQDLMAESGLGLDQDEMFWKGPTVKREVEQQVKAMSTSISQEINEIQSLLVTTLGKLSKKLQKEEKDGSGSVSDKP